ncbi:hypothetical protein [Bythopirellula goksoeyrii]|uniref:Uncharacterized protein n=1 Tax=Bythopirellula goksoeyrii TaxID=1400387 RepID=A0A5B9QAR6_9BACT|nr:hypothetical protein [Bythopirellula goksoeyrii]QEG35978.1 hypothetical protein Pr1d_32870 [Bythopirellula goksoeyrii]
MKPIHPDIAGKQFACVFLHMPERLDQFARDCRFEPRRLVPAIKEAIQTRHQESTPSPLSEHPPEVRYLEIESVGFYYQVLPEIVEIASLVSVSAFLPEGEFYSLSTDFTQVGSQSTKLV